jgi:subtilase family serine protease
MRAWKFLLPLLASTLCFAAQPDRITGPVNSNRMVVLPGQVNHLAKPEYDQGAVDPSTQLSYVTLVFAPSPSQQAALDQLLQQQQQRSSPYYHKWLTPEQYAARFGLSQADVTKVTGWLQSQGLGIVRVARGRNSVVFSGTAAQISAAFKTEIHHYAVNGEKHIANATSVSVPAALSGILTSVRGLHDFRPKPTYVRAVAAPKGPHPSYTTTVDGNIDYFIAPGDIATLYDITPLYNASTPINGTGQKLAIMGQTDIYYADLNDFRTGFGLPTFTCTTGSTGLITACNATNFSYVLLGSDPGTPSLGDLTEADLDVEWSGAIAQNAQIIFVNGETSGGVNDALVYAIDNVIAPVISMSYGLCEAEVDGPAGSLETYLQQANTAGITVLNSAGDVGSTACDYNPPNHAPPYDWAVGGLAVSYPASSPEVTGVGGTSIPTSEFTSAYWNSNGVGTVSNGGSALSTLVGTEVPWNDDEALSQFCISDPSNSFCNPSPGVKVTSAETFQQDYWLSIGGGGVSNCFNLSGGLCSSGFTRPAWQTVTIPGQTSPQSGYRLVPDVSLLASPNYPGYIICTPVEELSQSSPYDTESTSSCASGIASAADGTIVNNEFVIDPSIIGGTSASTPVFAGIVTLINQYVGGTTGLGNINPQLYSLAATPSNGIFHPITTGDNDAFCQPGDPVGDPADVICPTGTTPGTIGFEASNADATNSYNLVTGLGSVDANLLAQSFAPAAPAFSMTATLSGSSVMAGNSATATITVTPAAPSPGMTVNFSNNTSCSGLPTGGNCSFNPTSVNGQGPATVTVTISIPANATAQTYPIVVTGTASGTSTQSQTATISLPVTKTNQSFSIAAGSTSYSVVAGSGTSISLTVSSSNGFVTGSGSNQVTALPLTFTCTGLPSEATGAFSPATGTNNCSGATATTTPASVTLAITTTAPTSELRMPLRRGSRMFYALLMPGLFGVILAAGSRARTARLLGLMVVLGLSTLWLGSCGGSSSSSSGGSSNPGTPAGTYKVTINATTGGAVPLTGTTTITLIVTSST